MADRLIDAAHISEGSFDNVAAARYAVPSHWDVGKVYKRLALNIAEDDGIPLASAALSAYNSPVSAEI